MATPASAPPQPPWLADLSLWLQTLRGQQQQPPPQPPPQQQATAPPLPEVPGMPPLWLPGPASGAAGAAQTQLVHGGGGPPAGVEVQWVPVPVGWALPQWASARGAAARPPPENPDSGWAGQGEPPGPEEPRSQWGGGDSSNLKEARRGRSRSSSSSGSEGSLALGWGRSWWGLSSRKDCWERCRRSWSWSSSSSSSSSSLEGGRGQWGSPLRKAQHSRSRSRSRSSSRGGGWGRRGSPRRKAQWGHSRSRSFGEDGDRWGSRPRTDRRDRSRSMNGNRSPGEDRSPKRRRREEHPSPDGGKRCERPTRDQRDSGRNKRSPSTSNRNQPVREQSHPTSGGARRSSPKRRREEHPGPDGGKRRERPTRDQKDLGSERRDRSSSTSRQTQPVREQSHPTSGGAKQSSPKRRREEHPSPDGGKRRERPTRDQKDSGSNRHDRLSNTSRQTQPVREKSHPTSGGVRRSSPKRRQEEHPSLDGGKEEKGEGSCVEDTGCHQPPVSRRFFSKDGQKWWTPCQTVTQWWLQCQTTLDAQACQQLLSTCPRPLLPGGTSKSALLNDNIRALLTQEQADRHVAAMHGFCQVQEEALDMLGPAMKICDAVERGLRRQEQVDPLGLQEWVRNLIRYIGGINQRVIRLRRVDAIGAIHPQLKGELSDLIGPGTAGKLFPENTGDLLEKLLRKIPGQGNLQAEDVDESLGDAYKLGRERAETVAQLQGAVSQ